MQAAEYVTTMVFADTPLLRRWPAAYKDGVYEPSGHLRPNPLDLSEQLLKGEIGTKSRTGKTALLVFFGKGLEKSQSF
jgi:dual oxidase